MAAPPAIQAADPARQAADAAVDLQKAFKVISELTLEELEHELFLLELSTESFTTQIRKLKDVRADAFASMSNCLVRPNDATEVNARSVEEMTAIVLARKEFGVKIHMTNEAEDPEEKDQKENDPENDPEA